MTATTTQTTTLTVAPYTPTVTSPRPGMWVVGDATGKYLVKLLPHGELSCPSCAEPDPCSHARAVRDHAGLVPADDTIRPIPLPSHPMFRGTGGTQYPPLPDWVTELRPHQWAAVQDVLDAFNAGAKVVWLDAPTGSGKTLIGEIVRRLLGVPALYVCSGKTLQDQFLADFPYASVLKGRANYPTMFGDGVTASDCTRGGGDDSCMFCDPTTACPYNKAKYAAMASDIAVINTSYLLTEANGPGKFSGRGLGILDECDVLEQELMGQVEFRLTDRMARDLGVTAPKKGSHYPTIIKWMGGELRDAVDEKLRRTKAQGVLALGDAGTGDVKRARKIRQLEQLKRDIDRAVNVARDETAGEDGRGGWVRDNDGGPLVLKPVTIDRFGGGMLWRHAEKWLCMSATIVSAEQMADSLGVADGEWAVVRVPMTFPEENRPIYQCPVANMTAKDKADAWPAMVEGIVKVLEQEKYRGERVLVHAVSYALADAIVSGLRRKGIGREVVTYRGAGEREAAIAKYRSIRGAVMVASSLDRGVDFKGDDCRCVIVAKVPFPYLGDPQVSKRMHQPGGNEWYVVQTVRTVVQMTGRGVRSADDWADTWVLDAQFGTNLWKKARRMFPRWWSSAVEFIPRKELMGRA